MADPVIFDADTLGQLDDQQWRRLGVTQTFDRLLVEAAATTAGPVDAVRDHAGRNLAGGAAKFWLLSFPQMKRDLVRKRVLAESDGQLGLHADFAERLERLLAGIAAGASRVEPTPGVTLEELNARAAVREKAAKARSRSTTRRSSTSRSSSRSAAAKAAAPKTRSGAKPAGGATATPAIAMPAPKPTPTVAPPKKLFTSRTVNTLLDRLDNNTLSKSQLGDRIGLRGRDLDRFLEVTGEKSLTRIARDDLVELHWEGRKMAQTSGGDRRMAVITLVDELRAAASAPEDG